MWVAQQAVLISPLPRTFHLTRNFLELNTHNYDRKLSKIGYEYFRCLLGNQRKHRAEAFEGIDPELKERLIVESSWVPLLHPYHGQKYYYNYATNAYSLYPQGEVQNQRQSQEFDALAALRAFLEQQKVDCEALLQPAKLGVKKNKAVPLPAEFSLAHAHAQRPRSSSAYHKALDYSSQQLLLSQRRAKRRENEHKLSGIFQVGKPTVVSKHKHRLARLPGSAASSSSLALASTRCASGIASHEKTPLRRHMIRNASNFEATSFRAACKDLLHKNLTH